MDGFEPGCNTAENSAFQLRDAVLGEVGEEMECDSLGESCWDFWECI